MDNIKRWLVYIIRFGRIVGRLLGGLLSVSNSKVDLNFTQGG